MDLTWKCAHYNVAIGDCDKYVTDTSGAPYAHAAYIHKHSTTAEKKPAKKDKDNAQR